MKYCLRLLIFCFFINATSQDLNYTSQDIAINSLIDGTLFATPKPRTSLSWPSLLRGSGPTDRNGNQNFLNNNSLKKLAESLADNRHSDI